MSGTELVTAFWEAVNRRDLPGLLELCDEQIELHSALGGSYQGRDGLERWWEGLFEAVGRYEGTVEDSLVLGELVLARVRVEASGQVSGMEGTRQVVQVFTATGGRVSRLAVHLEAADALEDAARQLR